MNRALDLHKTKTHALQQEVDALKGRVTTLSQSSSKLREDYNAQGQALREARAFAASFSMLSLHTPRAGRRLLREAEQQEREALTAQYFASAVDLHKKCAAALTVGGAGAGSSSRSAKAAPRVGSSRQLKMEADELYERTDYQNALELYNRAG